MRVQLHIALLLLLSGLLFGQAGDFLYDMGIVIDDSTRQAAEIDSATEEEAAGELRRLELERELEVFQEKLALTQMQLKQQTTIIDSLKNEIVQVQSARETDLALLNSKLTSIQAEKTETPPTIEASPANAAADSAWAELTENKPAQEKRQMAANQTLSVLTPVEERRYYKQGLTKFHQQYYYSAIEDFRVVVQRAANVERQATAQYWIGRSYFEKGLYDEAIMELEKVRQYPQSDMQDDALVLIGLAFQQKQAIPQAKIAFRELVNQYPASEYLTLARRFIRN